MTIKKIGLQLFAITALLSMAHSAFALSCARPDPVKQCKRMLESESSSPAFANGQLQLKKIISQEVKERNIGGKGPALAEYHFTGSLSDKNGKREVKDEKILISTSCAGPWCAGLPKDNKSGYFLLTTDTKVGLKIHFGACSYQPSNLTDDQIKSIEACVTPEPVKPKTSKPKPVKNTGGSQVYSQRNSDNKLVK